MKVNTIPATTLDAVSTLLSPYVTEISPLSLVRALKECNLYKEDVSHRPKDMMTKKQVCSMLNISLPTVNRMMKSGRIKFLKWGGLIRIPAEDIYSIASGEA